MRNELQIFNNSLFGEVRFLNIEGKPYAVANDVAKALGYKNTSKATNDHCKGAVKYNIPHPQSETKLIEVSIIPQEDILLLIQKAQTKSVEYKDRFKEWLILEGIIVDGIILESRKEIEFLDILEEQLKVFKLKGIRQYPVLNYKIDFYIPSLNIAIEYDEDNHSGYSYEEHEGRQIEISNRLNCRFIRVSDSKSHIENSAIIIKKIFNLKEIA